MGEAPLLKYPATRHTGWSRPKAQQINFPFRFSPMRPRLSFPLPHPSPLH
uniref:Uncharacterized protein n=1 Tax=Arundo donax TaxID=35708 RepID=A0A0A9SAG5_ARUDO